jgi:hypothetical protein
MTRIGLVAVTVAGLLSGLLTSHVAWDPRVVLALGLMLLAGMVSGAAAVALKQSE